MNTAKWSERQQVIAIIAGAAAIIAALWFFLLAPLNLRRRQLERDIRAISGQLAQQNYLLGEEKLLRKRGDEEARYAALCTQWTQAVAQLSMSVGGTNSLESDVSHIDFKVALFDVKERLRKRSNELKIKLPRNLGLDEFVGSGENARKLMLQLRAVEEAADMVLNLKISEIQYIEPLPPIPHALAAGAEPFLEEFPVKVRFFGTASNLYAGFQAAFRPNHTFAFKNLKIEKVSPNQPDLLDVTAVVSAMVFKPDFAPAASVEQPPAGPVAPMGY